MVSNLFYFLMDWRFYYNLLAKKIRFLPIIRDHHWLRQFIKFCIVGSISAIINFGVLYSLTEWLHVWYIISAILGFILAVIFNFCLNKFWTFRNLDKKRGALNQLLKFLVVSLTGLVINTLIIYNLTEFIKFDYRLSWVFACAAVTFWNFCLNKFWTFK